MNTPFVPRKKRTRATRQVASSSSEHSLVVHDPEMIPKALAQSLPPSTFEDEESSLDLTHTSYTDHNRDIVGVSNSISIAPPVGREPPGTSALYVVEQGTVHWRQAFLVELCQLQQQLRFQSFTIAPAPAPLTVSVQLLTPLVDGIVCSAQRWDVCIVTRLFLPTIEEALRDHRGNGVVLAPLTFPGFERNQGTPNPHTLLLTQDHVWALWTCKPMFMGGRGMYEPI